MAALSLPPSCGCHGAMQPGDVVVALQPVVAMQPVVAWASIRRFLANHKYEGEDGDSPFAAQIIRVVGVSVRLCAAFLADLLGCLSGNEPQFATLPVGWPIMVRRVLPKDMVC